MKKDTLCNDQTRLAVFVVISFVLFFTPPTARQRRKQPAGVEIISGTN
jgi:hypothetical protein